VRVVTVTRPGASCETYLAVEESQLGLCRTLVLLAAFDPFAALQGALGPPEAHTELIAGRATPRGVAPDRQLARVAH
jgi:hypothetical protein